MPTDPATATTVLLLVPALDAGIAAAAPSLEPMPAAAAGPDVVPVTGPGVDSAADPLDAAAFGGTFERRALEDRPWEVRLMIALGLLDPGAETRVALAAVPAARLLGPDDLATAPPNAAGDIAAAAAAGRLVIADPVALTPGRDEATLTPPEALALSNEEADALIGSANELLAEDGIALLRGTSGRWYLAGLDACGLDTPPTHFLARREAGAHLPGASEAAPWRRLMTELQMLWHTHPVNAAREGRGAPAVNGVWFWGGCALPARPGVAARGSGEPVNPSSTPAAIAAVVTDDELATALARHAGVNVLGAADRDIDQALTTVVDGTLLVVDTAPYVAWLANDVAALERARRNGIERWLAPAARAVLDGRAATLTLAGSDGGEAVFVPPAARSWFERGIAGPVLQLLARLRPGRVERTR